MLRFIQEIRQKLNRLNMKAGIQYFLLFLFKAELLQEGIFFFIHLFVRDVLVMKELEIEKTKPALIYQF